MKKSELPCPSCGRDFTLCDPRGLLTERLYPYSSLPKSETEALSVGDIVTLYVKFPELFIEEKLEVEVVHISSKLITGIFYHVPQHIPLRKGMPVQLSRHHIIRIRHQNESKRFNPGGQQLKERLEELKVRRIREAQVMSEIQARRASPVSFGGDNH